MRMLNTTLGTRVLRNHLFYMMGVCVWVDNIFSKQHPALASCYLFALIAASVSEPLVSVFIIVTNSS